KRLRVTSTSRRQQAIAGGEPIVQETRGWHADREETRSMRSKESAHDYRYFPDPDLMDPTLDPAWIESIRATMPELPAERRARYERELGLSAYDADVLTQRKD